MIRLQRVGDVTLLRVEDSTGKATTTAVSREELLSLSLSVQALLLATWAEDATAALRRMGSTP